MRRKTTRTFAAAALAASLAGGSLSVPVYADYDLDSMMKEGSNQLAAELAAALYEEDNNLFISPYSIYTALSMLSHCASDTLASGADNESSLPLNPVKDELWTLLGIEHSGMAEGMCSPTDAEVAGMHGQFLEKLQKKQFMEAEEFSSDLDSCFESANALLISDTLPLSDAFPQLEEYLACYAAEITHADLTTEDTMDSINRWIEEHTHGLLPRLLEEPLRDEAAAVLLNAVYFFGQWATQFDEALTEEGTFHGTGGDTDARLMHARELWLSYYEAENYQALCLPFVNNYQMTVFLPDEDADMDLSDAEVLSGLMHLPRTDFQYGPVNVTLPVFEIEAGYNLAETLQALGLEAVFTGGVFDRLTSETLTVSDVVHKARISVNENGAEAAAYTAILMECGMLLPEDTKPIDFCADRPFFFTIAENSTGLVVFAGALNQIP